jgi:hypothetical protein
LSVFGTKFLLATDGSPESVHAARMVTELSSKLGPEMHLVYVEPTPSVYGMPERAVYAPGIQSCLETPSCCRRCPTPVLSCGRRAGPPKRSSSTLADS